MVEMNSNHCRVVSESLSGERPVDEQTFASLAVLSERLERLKEAGTCFAEIEFSPYVKKLRDCPGVMAVG